MPVLTINLVLKRCPHCYIATPNLFQIHVQTETVNHVGQNLRRWGIYKCGNCGGLVTAYAIPPSYEVVEYFPPNNQVEGDIPEKPRSLLMQAQESLHAPAGAVMLAASAIDSLLKLRGLKNGSFYARIEEAVEQNIITADMAKWAHEVRLDANDQRHADESADLPNEIDAKRVLDFALALAEILFTLPNRVTRGIENKL